MSSSSSLSRSTQREGYVWSYSAFEREEGEEVYPRQDRWRIDSKLLIKLRSHGTRVYRTYEKENNALGCWEG